RACCEVRNMPALRLGRFKIRPHMGTLAALANVTSRIGGRVAMTALQVKLAQLGIPPAVLRDVEAELQREELSLGALAKPAPKPGTLGALSTEAIAGQWLASKVL